jgi:hypothetical protein
MQVANIAHSQAIAHYVQSLQAHIARSIGDIAKVEAEKAALGTKKGNSPSSEDWSERRKTALEQIILTLKEDLGTLRRIERENSLRLEYLRAFLGGPWC